MTELPRLLFCCFEVIPGPTAVSRRLTEYIRGLSERFQVVVLSVKTPDHPHIERYQGARLLRVPVGSEGFSERAQAFDRAVRRQLESEEYGLVHFFDPFAGYALCERRSEFDYRLVYDACSFASVELPLEAPELARDRRFVARLRRQELFCLMNADAVVVGSPLTASYLADLGVAPPQLHVLRAPVDLTPFTPEVMGKPDATPMRVVHLGSAARGQGVEVLLEAMAIALQRVDLHLAVVGARTPESHPRLEQLVAERRLEGKVEFQPPVAHDDVFKVLAAADVGALSLDDVERNRTVGTPLARLAEYLAAGRPVVAADLPATRALLPDGCGLLYPPGDAAALADALVRLATHPDLRVGLGAAARIAAAQWDSARTRLDLLKVYAAITGASATAGPGATASDSDEGAVTQLRPRRGDSSSGLGRVKTDPAIAGPEGPTDIGAGVAAPAIMGVPLRDEAPPDAPATTTPPSVRLAELPVVLGAPLAEPAPEPAITAPTPGPQASLATTPSDEPAPPTPRPPEPRADEAAVTSLDSGPAAPIFVPPLVEGPPPLPDEPPRATADEDIPEVGADEVMEVESVEEYLDEAGVQAVGVDPTPPPSAIGPWFAQLVHGYCPPEAPLFDRHTPPTTTPGRDT